MYAVISGAGFRVAIAGCRIRRRREEIIDDLVVLAVCRPQGAGRLAVGSVVPDQALVDPAVGQVPDEKADGVAIKDRGVGDVEPIASFEEDAGLGAANILHVEPRQRAVARGRVT